MQPIMLRTRAGFTLAEVLVALTMTAIIGAAVTGAFISQSRFFDHQERVGSARNVSRAAVNVLMSELRMVEIGTGVVAATNTSITLRVPYALGLYCSVNANVMRISLLPTDPAVRAGAKYSGYALRTAAGTYQAFPSFGTNVSHDQDPVSCTGVGVTVHPSGGSVAHVPLAPIPAPALATPMFLFQQVTYSFGNSTTVSGRRALFRTTTNPLHVEELLAPFDTTAKFRFYVNDGVTAQTAAPGILTTITGLEVTLDGLSERPNGDGTFQSVPLRTSVFFRNR